MNFLALTTTRETLRAELKRLDAIQVGCSNCKNYELNNCKVFGEMPPGDWFKGPVECESWEFDQIPF